MDSGHQEKEILKQFLKKVFRKYHITTTFDEILYLCQPFQDRSLRPRDIFHCRLQVCVIGSFCTICDISITGGVGGVYII